MSGPHRVPTHAPAQAARSLSVPETACRPRLSHTWVAWSCHPVLWRSVLAVPASPLVPVPPCLRFPGHEPVYLLLTGQSGLGHYGERRAGEDMGSSCPLPRPGQQKAPAHTHLGWTHTYTIALGPCGGPWPLWRPGGGELSSPCWPWPPVQPARPQAPVGTLWPGDRGSCPAGNHSRSWCSPARLFPGKRRDWLWAGL